MENNDVKEKIRLWDSPGIMSPQIATVLASYNCTASCTHCCFDSHPGIKTRLELAEIIKFIDSARQFDTMKLIVFSGGECFLLGDDLTRAVEHATGLGLRTRCVTNGYWARTEESAMRRLSDLKAAGLCELNISTGDHHQKYVPQRLVINGVLASVKLDIPIVVMIELQKERRVTDAGIRSDRRIVDLLKTPAGKLFRTVESPWMPMSAEEVIPQQRGRLINNSNVHKRRGCRSVLTTIVATPTGDVGVCCGLTRERIPELHLQMSANRSLQEAYAQATSDFMNIWLFVEGPERILAWAASKDPAIDWENKYAHHCHACLAVFDNERVRAIIREHYHEKVNEVLVKYILIKKSGSVLAPDLELSSSSTPTPETEFQAAEPAIVRHRTIPILAASQ